MSELDDTANDIDDMLEQVAIAMATGDNHAAMDLLPKIFASGDEIQQQMADSYQAQLEALIAMEQESVELTGLIDGNSSDELDGLNTVAAFADNEILDETVNVQIAVEAEVSEIKDEQSTLDEDGLLEVANTDGDIVIESKESDNESVFASSLENDLEYDEVLTAPIIDSVQSIDDELLQEIPISASVAETFTETVEENDTIQPQSMSVATGLGVQEGEMEMALEQVAILLEDGEYETAEMLLQPVFASGNAAQRETAEAYMVQIRDLQTMSSAVEASETLSDNVVIGDDQDPLWFSTSDEIIAESEEASNKVSTLENVIIENENDTLTINSTEERWDDESVDNLLSPTEALGRFDFFSTGLLSKNATKLTEGKDNQRQGFFVGDVGLMIDFADGSELTEMPALYRVPNSPAWLMGLTNLHGIVIPVFNLQQYLDLGGSPQGAKEMLLILQHNEKAVGVVVNNLPRRLTYSQSQQMEHNTAPFNLSQHINNAYLIDENLWFDLDSASLCRGLEMTLQAS